MCTALAARATAAPARDRAGKGTGTAAAGGARLVDLAVWDVPSVCPDRATFLRLVGRHAARSRRRLEVEVRVTRPGGGWELSLVTRAAGLVTGRQTLRGRSCRAVVDAAALVVALAIDPSAAIAGATPAPDQVRDKETPPKTRAPTHGPGRLNGLAVREVIGVDNGSLPGVTPGLGIGLAALRGRWRLEIVATEWVARTLVAPPLNGMPPAGGEIWLLMATLRGCGNLVEHPLVVEACAAMEAGALRSTGFGADLSQTQNSPWVGASAGLAVAVAATPRLYVRAAAEASAPLVVRPEINLDPAHAIFRPARVVERGFVGLEVLFR